MTHLRRTCTRLLGAAGMLLMLGHPMMAQDSPVVNPASLGFSVARLARIDTVFRQYVDSEKVAGAVALIMRHGQIAYLHAFGQADREAKRPMTASTLFRIASQTKAVTSVAVMMLVEQGKLTLGDPVSRYIPSFAHTMVAQKGDTGLLLVPATRAITIRDLLTHTAGISYGTDSIVAERYRAQGLGPAAGWGWYTADKDEPVCTTMERLGTLPFVAQPGSSFVYGYNLDVLGCVVERVSGMPLDQFFRIHIFAPLGMRNTWFFPPVSESSRFAAVYMGSDSGLRRADDGSRGQGHYLAGPRKNFSGGAGLVSTAVDYGRFLQMLLNKGSRGAVHLLSPATVHLMTTSQVEDSVYGGTQRGFGLGFDILEQPGLAGEYGSVGRFGWGGAYGTVYWVDPGEDLVALFMVQQFGGSGLDLAGKFQALVYQAIVTR
ncbi:MAG: serine hydrolase domain-containing protein [Gemmatimonadota bacterium]